jgi:Icc-related predicted phosphoesterase
MKIDVVADLHGYYPQLAGGDLLIIAGDLTASDEKEEYDDFMGWLDIYECLYKKIVIIAGNHDNFLQSNPEYISSHEYENIEYLCDSGTEFDGLKIWGSPWSPWFPRINPLCKAFVFPDEALFDKWEMIPKGTDILITHTPAYGTLDYRQMEDGTKYHMGSKTLEAWIKYVERPLIHVFGHIHECGGMQAEEYATYNDQMMKSINCSYVNEKYRPVNKPITIIL